MASPEREDAVRALRRLAGLMQMQNKTQLATRLHRHAEAAEHTPTRAALERQAELQRQVAAFAAGANGDAVGGAGGDGGSSDAMERRFGVQVSQPDERVTLAAVESLSQLARLHAARGDANEAVRLAERVVDMEERRVGRFDARLVPLLLDLAAFLEEAGNRHEAAGVRERAAQLMDRPVRR